MIIDASSLLTLIKKRSDQSSDTLKQCITIPLIYYEIGNALRTSAISLKQITVVALALCGLVQQDLQNLTRAFKDHSPA